MYAKCAKTTVKIPKPLSSWVTEIGKTSVCWDFLNVRNKTNNKTTITIFVANDMLSVSVIGAKECSASALKF